MADAPFAGRRLHFVGIGGAGMSGLAIVVKTLGAEVTGSDRAESSYTARLREHGIEPAIGHDAANVPEGAELVVSTAIPPDNPEVAAASAPPIHRGELLGEVSKLKRSIAVAGTHGKTTTCGMAAHVLVEAGRDPAYLIGGELRSTGANAAWGEGEWMVVEADESDRSFLELSREVAVVTNVELDHHHTYGSLAELKAAFAAFTDGARVTIEEGDLQAEALELRPLGSRFTVDGVSVELSVPGRHNVSNALAALGACREAGLAIADAAPHLAGFSGAGRRFEDRGATPAGARVFDDYAHHPTRSAPPSRPRALSAPGGSSPASSPAPVVAHANAGPGVRAALALADVVAVFDVYPAGRRPRTSRASAGSQSPRGRDAGAVAGSCGRRRRRGRRPPRRRGRSQRRGSDLERGTWTGSANLTTQLASRRRLSRGSPERGADFPLERLETVRSGRAGEL